MPKRKLTKRWDDVLRGIRDPERYDPKARSFGGPWRMVKCKDGAYVCYELYLEVMENLRKSAEINPAQSPHDGIHTCSKGCSKPGCNRGLRDTIEEQNAQIKALKQDLKEESARSRHVRMKAIHFINTIGGLQEENARLKAEVEQLTQLRDTASWASERAVNRLQAEVENANRINRELLVLSNRQATEIRRLTDCKAEADQLKAEVERLIKAGDALAKTIGENGVHDNGSFHDVADSIDRWHAAKEGKPSV